MVWVQEITVEVLGALGVLNMITGQIPLPGSGMDALTNGLDSMFADLMNKRKIAIAQNQFKQQQERLGQQFQQQHALRRAQEQRMAEQFQQDFGLRKEASGRNAALLPLRQQMLIQQLQHAKNANDPMYEINKMKNLVGSFGGNGGEDFNSLKNNPLVRGLLKHKYGVDLGAQTPEEKQASDLDLFKQQEKIKADNKIGSGETLTAPIKTKYQNVIGGVTSARPILQKLIDETRKGNIPGQAIGALFKRDAQASYKGEISTLLDGIRNAYTIPNTDSGTAKAEDKVLRKSGESDDNYTKRLEGILAQIDAREKDARTKLNAGNITANLSNDDHSQVSSESDPLGIR